MLPILMMILMLGLVVGIVVLAIYFGQKKKERWRAFGERHGLEVNGLGWSQTASMTGRYRGLPVAIRVEVHGYGRNRKHYTRFLAGYRQPVPSGLAVDKEGFGAKVAKFFGGQDIDLGLPEADRRLRIKGHDEEEVREFFRAPGVVQAVLHFVTKMDGALTESAGTILKLGFVGDPNQLERRLDACVDVVYAIETAHGAPAEHAEAGGFGAPAAQPAPAAPAARPAPAAQVTAPAPAAAAAHAPAVTPAAATGGEVPAALLARLGSPDLLLTERKQVVEQLVGRRVGGTLQVSEVTWTTDMNVAERLRSGQTLIGSLGIEGAPDLAVRFPQAADEDIKALRPGGERQVAGAVAGWDDLYHRLLVDAD